MTTRILRRYVQPGPTRRSRATDEIDKCDTTVLFKDQICAGAVRSTAWLVSRVTGTDRGLIGRGSSSPQRVRLTR